MYLGCKARACAKPQVPSLAPQERNQMVWKSPPRHLSPVFQGNSSSPIVNLKRCFFWHLPLFTITCLVLHLEVLGIVHMFLWSAAVCNVRKLGTCFVGRACVAAGTRTCCVLSRYSALSLHLEPRFHFLILLTLPLPLHHPTLLPLSFYCLLIGSILPASP